MCRRHRPISRLVKSNGTIAHSSPAGEVALIVSASCALPHYFGKEFRLLVRVSNRRRRSARTAEVLVPVQGQLRWAMSSEMLSSSLRRN